MRGSLLVLLFLWASQIQAQPGMIRGRIADTAGAGLPQITVSTYKLPDTLLADIVETGVLGEFEITQLETGSYFLKFSYEKNLIGSRAADIKPGQLMVDLGLVKIDRYKELSNVTVTDLVPVRIKSDTLIYEAGAFKTRSNATAEDLIRKLPGMQVNRDGTISAMGETIQKVYVDGKDFFGNDPKLATGNIMADMIDQVQVYDDMSESSKFSKVDDGSRQKAINLKLKSDKKKGSFGNFAAGAGNEERYEGNGNYHLFKKDLRLSAIAALNNTSRLPFSFSEAVNLSGGVRGLASLGGSNTAPAGKLSSLLSSLKLFTERSGSPSAAGGGLNYSDIWGSRIDFRSSYYYSSFNNDVRREVKARSFFLDSISEMRSNSSSGIVDRNHRFNARWEYSPDSVNSFLYTTQVRVGHSENAVNDTSATYVLGMPDFLAVAGRTRSGDQTDAINYSGELLYRRKLGNKGGILLLGWRNGFSETEAEEINDSPFSFYKPDGGPEFTLHQNYIKGDATRINNNLLSATLVNRVMNNKFLDLVASHGKINYTSDVRTYDYNSSTEKYDLLNQTLTNYFEFSSVSNKAGFNFRSIGKRIKLQAGASVLFTEMKSTTLRPSFNDSTLISDFIDFLPSLNIQYSINKVKNLKFDYSVRPVLPTIYQLQDVVDPSDPTRLRMGNSALNQSMIHALNFNYTSARILAMRFFSANLSFLYHNDKIVNSIDSAGKYVTVYRPVNSDNNYTANAFLTLGFPIKTVKGSYLNFTTIALFDRETTVIYNRDGSTRRYLASQMVNIGYAPGSRFDVSASAMIAWNMIEYETNPEFDGAYFFHDYWLDAGYRLGKFQFTTQFDLRITSGYSQGYDQSIPIWSSSVSRYLMKKKQAEIKFFVFDILGRNRQVQRTVSENFVQDISSNVVGRYFLVSLIFRFQKNAGHELPLPRQIGNMIEGKLKRG